MSFEEEITKYIMEWGDWIDKLRLLAFLQVDFQKVKLYVNRLTALQLPSGGFPKNWNKKFSEGILETALALEILSKIGAKQHEASSRAARFLIQSQHKDGCWIDTRNWQISRRVTLVTAKVSKALATYGIRNKRVIKKALQYIEKTQRADGFWLTSRADEKIDLEASSEAILFLLQLIDSENNRKIQLMVESGIDALRNWLVSKLTEEWSKIPREALAIVKALVASGYNEMEIVKKILRNYTVHEKWKSKGRGRAGVAEAVNLLEVLLMSKVIDKKLVEEKIKNLISIREKLKKIIETNINKVNNYFAITFNEIGLRSSDPVRRILLGCFTYAILDQFFWVSDEFNPELAFHSIRDIIGDVDNIENYADFTKVNEALMKIKILRGIAKRRKIEVARSISLFANFIIKYEPFRKFRDFAIKLRAYTLFEIPHQICNRDSIQNLGLLLRSFSKAESEIEQLVKAAQLALECYPAVGPKIASLFLFYIIWVFNLWPEAKPYINCPIDWNIAKPYLMLGLSSFRLKELRKDPKRASKAIYKLASELFPNNPANIVFLWIVGREWCTRPYRCKNFAGKKCWIYNLCRGVSKHQGEKNME